MFKCHCAEVFFQDILTIVKETNRPILEVAKEMGAAETCTACVADMLSFIQNELEGLSLAGHTTHRS
jgi:bacterioferritin-associated ferredoxin